jgi:hypothetical protein
MYMLLRIIRGISGFIAGWQIIGLLPIFGWWQNIESVTSEMWALVIFKLFVLLVFGAIFFALRAPINKLHKKKTTNLLRTTEGPRTMLDEVEEKGGALLVAGYRHLAAAHSCAPTGKTSDREIIDMYKTVGTAFRAVADQRGERLPAGIINYIVWKFLLVKEMIGAEMVDQHLSYETRKYLAEGLRDDYKKDIKLF